MEENFKQYSIKKIKGYSYIYFWIYMPKESISKRRETAIRNKEKYIKSREAWQKANSYYKWRSMGRADQIVNLNDTEIDLYIEKKMNNSIKRLRKSYTEKDIKNEIDELIQSWQEAKIVIRKNKENIKKEINSFI